MSVSSAALVSYEAQGSEASYDCPPDRLEVQLVLDVSSTDGRVASSGAATLRASELGAPFADLAFAHDAVLAPDLAADLEDAVPDGASASGMQLTSDYGAIALTVAWDSPDEVGWDQVYTCTYQGTRVADVTDCMTMAGP